MNLRRRIARYIAFVVGGLLCVVGVVHDIVNVPSFLRAIARGEIVARMGRQLVANVAFGGLALSLLGVLLFLSAPELGRGKHAARRLGIVIGLFFLLGGVAGYLWDPRPRVFIFSVLGGLVCGPLLLWRKEFLVE